MRATSYSAPATVHPPPQQAQVPAASSATGDTNVTAAPDAVAAASAEDPNAEQDLPGGKRDLPPALKAKLQARGILRLQQATSAANQQQQQSAEAVTYAAAAYAVPDPDAAVPVAAPQPAATAEGPLPPGWFTAMDTTYHRPYFYNPSTGERTWERPAPPLPPGWAEAKDPVSGVTYFYNASTGTSFLL